MEQTLKKFLRKHTNKGLTTNPSLMKKNKLKINLIFLKKILKVIKYKPISFRYVSDFLKK